MKRILILLVLVLLASANISLAQDKIFPKKGQLGVMGWVDFKIPGSLLSLEKHADQLDQVYLKCYDLQANAMPHPLEEATAELKARAVAAARKNNVIVWIEATNHYTPTADYEPKLTGPLLHTPAIKSQYIQQLVAYALRDGANGIMIDFRLWSSGKGAGNGAAFKTFVSELSAACKAHGLYCGVRAPHMDRRDNSENAMDYASLLGMVDQLIPIDEYMYGDLITPFSAPEYVELELAYASTCGKPSKMVLSYRNDGLDWSSPLNSTMITQQDFKALAQKYNVAPRRDDYSVENSIVYSDQTGKEHTAWISDGRTLEFNCDVAKKYNLYGIGVYRLGAEDENFWATLKKVTSTALATASLLPPEAEPPMIALRPIQLFTDETPNTGIYSYPGEGSNEAHHGGAHHLVIYKNGKRWWDLSMEGDTYSGGGIYFPVHNLKPYLATGALQFYVRGMKGGETFEVGFSIPDWIKDKKTEYHFVTEVPITDYVKVSTAWKLVTIPLNEFKGYGTTWSNRNGGEVHTEFRWHRVNTFIVQIDTPTGNQESHAQFAGVRIIPAYDPKEITKEKSAMQTE